MFSFIRVAVAMVSLHSSRNLRMAEIPTFCGEVLAVQWLPSAHQELFELRGGSQSVRAKLSALVSCWDLAKHFQEELSFGLISAGFSIIECKNIQMEVEESPH